MAKARAAKTRDGRRRAAPRSICSRRGRLDRPAGRAGRPAGRTAGSQVGRGKAGARGRPPKAAPSGRCPRARPRSLRALVEPEPRRRGRPRAPRATAESLAQKQREISVSEFFAKNRHLLGFDNPSKALLTTIKEAVDNSLDACEEAGILPELTIEVHDLALEAAKQDAGAHQGRGPLPRGRPGQRPRHRQGAGAEDLRQAALRLASSTASSRAAASRASASPRPRCTASSPPASRSASRAGWARRKAAHVFDIQLDTRKNEPVVTHDETLAQWHQEHGTRVELEIVANWQQGQRFVNRYVEHTALANPHATIHYTRPVGAAQRASADRPGNETLTLPARRGRAAQGGARDQAAPARRRAGRAHADGARVEEPRRARLPADDLQPRLGPGRERDPGQGALGQEDGAAARRSARTARMAEELHKAIAATRSS